MESLETNATLEKYKNSIQNAIDGIHWIILEAIYLAGENCLWYRQLCGTINSLKLVKSEIEKEMEKNEKT